MKLLLIFAFAVLSSALGGPTCRLGCPRIYMPVCTRLDNSSFLQFPNQCEFEKFACLNELDLYAIDGECNEVILS
ncbi:turripeptide Ici9.2-like [Hermetia illucens]|uniref:turripeptide Ici9.2-like n=1 Tax=Hermetia illucens TaxID=343691 RepID=UPI0018CC6204|nr:turripeptide Ici9.2-like [Hermetia illucens]